MADPKYTPDVRGIYNVDYFSGAQAAVYIGDVMVDEITSINYQRMQSRAPIYGYASQLFDDVSEGTVLVTGNFSINFKEAGYLWLILNRYKALNGGPNKLKPWEGTTFKDDIVSKNIERMVNGDPTLAEKDKAKALEQILAWASLTGFPSPGRVKLGKEDPIKQSFGANLNLGGAEHVMEMFENAVWGGMDGEVTRGNIKYNVNDNRQADSPDLNPFDIYVSFGDYVADDSLNHTVQKLEGVHLLGNAKSVNIDGQPIQEVYNFIARDLI